LYQTFDSEGVADALTINGIIMDAATKPKHFDYLRTLGIDTKRVRLSYPDNFAGIVPVGSKDQQTGIYSFKLGLPYRPLHLCHLLTSRLVVYDDGQVSACPGRDSENVMNIGDIKTEGFLEMRNGPKYKNMVDAFMARKIDDMPLCAKCDIPYVLHG
jgi:radical SAM protein with 4Fe4S-binding SPASM domain